MLCYLNEVDGVRGVMFFFKQKTAYEMRISDWSSDVCSSDLAALPQRPGGKHLCRLERDPARPDRTAGPRLGCRFDEPGEMARLRPQRRAERQRALEMRAERQFLGQPHRDGHPPRSEARRVGKGCVGTCRVRGWPDDKKKKKK